MSLSQMKWTEVPIDMLVHKFLLAERDTRLPGISAAEMPAVVRRQGVNKVLDQPDFSSLAENHARLRLLCLIRRWLICELPPDTKWYEVQSLTDNELSELRIIGRCGLDNWAEENKLLRMRQTIPLIEPFSRWKPLFLFGHDKAGPFTILEGNHRLAAYVSNGQKGLDVPVYVGLSVASFFFNPLDLPEKLVNDLWR